MNKKGFTLIELLAVIVILAVIAIIVTPVVTGIITKTKLSADMRSAEGYVKAAEGFYADSLINENKKDKIGTNIANDIEVSGNKPNGELIVSDKGKVSMAVIINNKCYSKNELAGLDEIEVSDDIDKCHAAVIPPDRCFEVSGYLEAKGGVSIKKYLCGDSVASLDTKDAVYNNDGEYLNIITPATINGYKVVGLDGYSFTARAVGDKVGVKSIKMLSGGLASYAIAKNEIEYLELSPTVDHLYSFVVRNNNHLKHVKLPTNFEMAGGPFFNNTIDTLEFENGPDNYKIADFSFEENKINHVILSDNIVEIGNYVFYGNEMTDINVPSSLKKIGEYAFYDSRLSSFDFSNITSVGQEAFAGNQLTNVTIPNTLTVIGNGAFNGNNFDNAHAFFYSQNDANGNGIIEESEYDKTILTGYAGANKNDVKIPSSVLSISDFGLSDAKINTIDLGSNITSIGNNGLSSNNLTSIVIPSSISQLSTGVLSNNPLVSVTIPNSVTSIQDSAFDFTSLASITLPNNLSSIGSLAFRNSNLETITIPNSVNTIKSNGLYGMSNLKTINIDKASGSIAGSPWGSTGATVNWLR